MLTTLESDGLFYVLMNGDVIKEKKLISNRFESFPSFLVVQGNDGEDCGGLVHSTSHLFCLGFVRIFD